MYCLQ